MPRGKGEIANCINISTAASIYLLSISSTSQLISLLAHPSEISIPSLLYLSVLRLTPSSPTSCMHAFSIPFSQRAPLYVLLIIHCPSWSGALSAHPVPPEPYCQIYPLFIPAMHHHNHYYPHCTALPILEHFNTYTYLPGPFKKMWYTVEPVRNHPK